MKNFTKKKNKISDGIILNSNGLIPSSQRNTTQNVANSQNMIKTQAFYMNQIRNDAPKSKQSHSCICFIVWLQ